MSGKAEKVRTAASRKEAKSLQVELDEEKSIRDPFPFPGGGGGGKRREDFLHFTSSPFPL